jgi:hypothetical protein
LNDLTVIYFTSNREKPEFERRIQQTLLDTIDGLPLISVSQEPMDFGKNICVGEKEPSTPNALKQLQIGTIESKTKYVCLAESDFIYPKEYFEFRPERIDTGYLASPVYVLFAQRNKSKVFAKKSGGCDSAMVIGRDCLIEGIERAFNNGPVVTFKDILNCIKHEKFEMSIPAITFKTNENMHRMAPIRRSSICRELPEWGTSHELIRKYMT